MEILLAKDLKIQIFIDIQLNIQLKNSKID